MPRINDIVSRSGVGGHRRGFTLFEVAISLVILAFGVVSIMTLFPAGLKAQQLARFQLYAAAKAEEMIEQFNTAQADNATADTEGTDIWQVPSSYRSQTWDLDARISSHRYGMMPLPLDLARRLDSDNDEIQQILAEGGYVYYSQPQASTGMAERSVAEAPPNEAQKLIIGITGYAQQNALPIFPMKNWPYFANFPSPPLHFNHMSDPWLPPKTASGPDYFQHYRYPKDDYESLTYCWETARIPGLSQPIPGTDPDLQKVFDWPEGSPAVHYGYFPYACGRQWDHGDKRPTRLGNVDGDHPNRAAALRYVQAALWYCQQKSLIADSGITAAFWSDPHAAGIPTFTQPDTTPDHRKWMQVQAMRFLSHAATCLTSWYPLNTTTGVDDLTTGVRIPSVVLDGRAGAPEMRITHELIRYYHERGLKLAMAFAASFPYDWAVPRPIERSIMTDFPLLQYDLFPSGGGASDPLTGGLAGTIFGTAVPARQWHPLAPRPIRNIGLSQTYPVNAIGGRHKLEGTQVRGAKSNLFGDADHYSLTMPFAASERCRELVFWTVDWQAYEDCETLPSAPLDASRYPLAGPRCQVSDRTTWWSGTPRDFNGRMRDVDFVDPHLFCFRNPEKNMLWVNDRPRQASTGTDVTADQLLHRDDLDQGPELERRQVFSGIWGADRNYNKKVDRGPVPKSVRMRAVQVARFNFYDPRIVCLLR
jgi:type II secretory pathway pseudopilin PulG